MPQLGINAETVYKGQPVGNSPEFMPLNMLLNKDTNRSYDYHCALTYHLPFNHLSKFSNKTQHWISKGIKRLVDLACIQNKIVEEGFPCSWILIQHCDQALHAMEIDYQRRDKIR